MRRRMNRIRKGTVNRGFTPFEPIIAVVAAITAIIVAVVVVLLVLYLVGYLRGADRTALDRQAPVRYIVLGGDIDVFDEDDDGYREDGFLTKEPESRQYSPFDVARQCGRKNCRIASVDPSAAKSTTGPMPDLAKRTQNG